MELFDLSKGDEFMKRILLVLALLLVVVSSGLFAEDPTLKVQYNEPGQINLTGVVGFNGWGLSFGVGAERIMGTIDIPEFPMEWGLAARGIFSFYLFSGYSGLDYGAAPLATIHKGISFGKNLEFDFTLGLGIGLYGYNYSYDYGFYSEDYSSGIKLGFASFDSVSWKWKENLWLTLEYGYVGWEGIYGVGVRMVL
jgi:opacity protein-like surface antigen